MACEPGSADDAGRGVTRGPGRARDDADRGATATEYAILVGFIAVVIAVAIAFFGAELSDYIHHIAVSVSAAF